jgi:hypothetical protein
MPAGSSSGISSESSTIATSSSAQRVERLGVLEDAHRDVGLGMRGAQLGQRRRHDARGGAGERADAQARALHPGRRQDLGLGQAQLGEDRLGVAQQDLTGRRQRHAARVAHEQARAELALEARDLLGDRGLGEREGGRGIGERAARGDLAKNGEQARVEHNGSLSVGEANIIGFYLDGPPPSFP